MTQRMFSMGDYTVYVQARPQHYENRIAGHVYINIEGRDDNGDVGAYANMSAREVNELIAELTAARDITVPAEPIEGDEAPPTQLELIAGMVKSDLPHQYAQLRYTLIGMVKDLEKIRDERHRLELWCRDLGELLDARAGDFPPDMLPLFSALRTIIHGYNPEIIHSLNHDLIDLLESAQ